MYVSKMRRREEEEGGEVDTHKAISSRGGKGSSEPQLCSIFLKDAKLSQRKVTSAFFSASLWFSPGVFFSFCVIRYKPVWAKGR